MLKSRARLSDPERSAKNENSEKSFGCLISHVPRSLFAVRAEAFSNKILGIFDMGNDAGFKPK